ncbi:MAG: hypothetical protein AAGH88_00195 [Planctomycetota bacterium]
MTDPTPDFDPDTALPVELQARLDTHLDAVDDVLRKHGKSRSERSAIVDELANQIIEMIADRREGEPKLEDLDAVLAEIDPPEAYARHSIDLPVEGVLPGFPEEASVVASRFNRATMFGLIWLVGFVFSFLLIGALLNITVEPTTYVPHQDAYGRTIPGGRTITKPPVHAYQTWWGIMLLIFVGLPGLLAPIGTTILGWVGISQIKHSAGRQHGMGLAVFNALFFILLAVLGCILCISQLPTLFGLFVQFESHSPAGRVAESGRALLVLIPLMVVFTLAGLWFSYTICRRIVRKTWRKANEPVGIGL